MDNDEIKSENSHDIKLTLATKSDNVIYSSEADSNKVIKNVRIYFNFRAKIRSNQLIRYFCPNKTKNRI